MLPADIPDDDQLIALMDFRAEPAVTLALASSPLPQDHERVKIALRNSIDEVERTLSERGFGHDVRSELKRALDGLLADDDFWTHQSRSIVVLAAPGRLEAFRLANHLRDIVTVNDRFDLAPLLRAKAYPSRAFVLQLAEGLVRLTEIGPDHGPLERPLDLPEDHAYALAYAENDGQLDRHRAQGADGDRIERERFCRIVQDQVVRVVPDAVPLILAATTELEPAYRAVNTHRSLQPRGIAAHPQSLDDAEIESQARQVLDDLRAAETSRWKERFGTLRAQGLATTKLTEVAAATAQAAIDELRFDMDAEQCGTIDEFGRVHPDDGDDCPRLVDEIAARVLHTGGKVRAVRQHDLLDGSPVAATLRFPVTAGR
jgi:hypothetical protein